MLRTRLTCEGQLPSYTFTFNWFIIEKFVWKASINMFDARRMILLAAAAAILGGEAFAQVDKRAEKLSIEATEAYNEQNYGVAIAKLTEAIKLAPDYQPAKVSLATVYNTRALIFVRRRDYKNAAKDLEQAINFKPDSKKVLSNYAQVCLHLKQFQRALELAERAKNSRLKGLALLGLNRIDDAIAELKQVEPTDPSALVGLTIAYRKRGDAASSDSYRNRIPSGYLPSLREFAELFGVETSWTAKPVKSPSK